MNAKLLKLLKFLLIVVGVTMPFLISGWQQGWLKLPTSETQSGTLELELSQEQLNQLEEESDLDQPNQLSQPNSQLAAHPLITNQTIDSTIAIALMKFQVDEIVISDLSLPATTVIALTLSDGRRALINDKPELVEEQLFKLRLILEYFEFENLEDTITEIDVRYRLPVLRTNQLDFESDQNGLIEP